MTTDEEDFGVSSVERLHGLKKCLMESVELSGISGSLRPIPRPKSRTHPSLHPAPVQSVVRNRGDGLPHFLEIIEIPLLNLTAGPKSVTCYRVS